MNLQQTNQQVLPVQPPVQPPVLQSVQLSETVKDAFMLILDDPLKYKKLTSGEPSPIRYVLRHYHIWFNTKKNKKISKKDLNVKLYPEWKNFIFSSFGIDFSTVNKRTFLDYKKLYVYNKLHNQVAQGNFNLSDIRKYGRPPVKKKPARSVRPVQHLVQPVRPVVELPEQLVRPSKELMDAFRLMHDLAGKNDSDKYQKLTTGEPSPLRLVYENYHQWLNWKKGINIPKEFLVVEQYSYWLKFILNTYDIDFTNVKYDTFRHDYKKLYVQDDLHVQAARGFIRHSDIRKYGR